MLPPPSERALGQLLARKEEEWRALRAHRCQLQEAALQDAHSQLHEAQGALRRLREDFVYNLQVLDERDRELERYDAAFARARAREEARQAEVSELRVEAARLRRALASEARRLDDLQRRHQMNLEEHRLERERAHSEKNGEIDQQREQYENLKWRLERKLEELDGELALQRQELLLELESETQKREHEFRLQADRMSNEVLTHELKVKLLDKELAALKEAAARAAESLRSAEAANSELRDQLQRGGQELRDLAAAKDARIKDLEGQLHSEQRARKKEEEAFRRKHEALDHLAREKDAVLVAMKGAHVEQLQALEARALELQAHGDSLELQLCGAERRQAEALKEKDAAVDKLREEASALKSGWDAQVAQLSKDLISKDLQIQALQEEAVELKAQLARCQQDVGRYKQQLLAAVERERCLHRDKVQLELDWRHRCDSRERDHYRASEDLLQALTAARDQVAAKLQETERTLCDQEVVLKALTLERDQAVQALRTRGLLPEKEVLLRHREEEVSESFPSSEIQRLQEQNASLRRAVAEMREEMETLNDQVLPPEQSGGQASDPAQPLPKAAAEAAAPDYIMVLETEIRNLKHKFKTLEGQVEDVLDPSKMSSSHSDVQASVHLLAEVPGGAVPADGTPMGLALGRLRNRTRLLNFLVARLRQKVLQKPLVADTVQHEVGQVHLEALELQKQVAELEEHIGSHWRSRALDQVALARQVPADQGPMGTKDQKPQPPQVSSVPRLQRKLKEAAREIVRLRLEKEQLLETGNRLRAELGRGPERVLVGTVSEGVDLCFEKPCQATRSCGTSCVRVTPHRVLQERSDWGKPPNQPLPTPEAWNQSEAPLGQVKPHSAAQGSKSAKTEHSSGRPGEARPHLAQSISRRSSLPGCTAGAEAGSGQGQHGISRATYRSARQKESRSPKPHLAQESREEKSHHTQSSSSSPASGPLQDTWKLLDLGSSPSGLTSQDDSVPELTAPPAADSLRHPDGSPVGAQAALAIQGVKTEAQAKARPARIARAHPAKTKCCQRPPKIRNYNLKD
ncbi:coiled-coil domain-containing protein 57 isoform X1 [Panthera tigris]|uniref:coiled-coil domain-containing protein 57 isoform X1 n=1 Tax=Panthera tigris TaxID=9694 RepID=UPI001C6FA0DC|nr:coiled-coil domain-containing protein 57 isoform X1 [Panthera tigris]XP_042823551.1 coiled-coil domain-containing protein 57 isoform X1 [Panthera tigris]XP_042823552.1 coiled-coil domain-containing protein 57 isoform X1 [Panthera tigris]XP_042823553.1 coiled-coil domain-containing protein 57 isoform X1 [Panthera tigris]XP_042823554.1 coiled-coil domain-containing protein 57 isoform X1 [Panthera tigris]XP_042823555.1 coiled-coil domain-containing protein 57 isoform X1 [Panthera tigris]